MILLRNETKEIPNRRITLISEYGFYLKLNFIRELFLDRIPSFCPSFFSLSFSLLFPFIPVCRSCSLASALLIKDNCVTFDAERSVTTFRVGRN